MFKDTLAVFMIFAAMLLSYYLPLLILLAGAYLVYKIARSIYSYIRKRGRVRRLKKIAKMSVVDSVSVDDETEFLDSLRE